MSKPVIKVTEKLFFPDEECIDLSLLDARVNHLLVSLPPKTRQLNLGSKRFNLKQTVIEGLTHLFIDNMDIVKDCEMPKSLKHLFLCNLENNIWKDVPNIYIEKINIKKSIMEPFLEKYPLEQFHIFNSDSLDPGCFYHIKSYTLSHKKLMNVFGRDISYRTMTRNKPLPSEPTMDGDIVKNETTPNPKPKLSYDELVELNLANLPDAIKNLPKKIYDKFHQDCLEGRAWDSVYTVNQDDIPKGYDLSYIRTYLARELEGFYVQITNQRSATRKNVGQKIEIKMY